MDSYIIQKSNEEENYLLIGERQGVAADEAIKLTGNSEGRIVMAQTAEELADKRVTILPVKPATSES